jgi:hypothetical protein
MQKPRKIRGFLSCVSFRFKSRSPRTALLVQQLRDFPNGSFDDGPDALEMSRRLAIRLVTKGRK